MSEMITKLWRRLPGRRAPGGSGMKPMAQIASNDPLKEPVVPDNSRYINREISDLQFIERVMEEVHNENHPLLERLGFLSISASVLDQFYSVRVARLRHSAKKQDAYITPDGMTPIQQLKAVTRRGEALMVDQLESWEEIRAELADNSIRILDSHELDVETVDWLHHYFTSHILPVLTPCTIDEEHPFPFIASGEVCTILEFADRHILIPLPPNLPRFIPLPDRNGDEQSQESREESRFILLESVLFRFWTELFPHDTMLSYGVFQILRDNKLAKQERSDDLRSIIESGLRLRHTANTILLKVADTMSERSISFVATQLDLLSDSELMFFEHANRRISEAKNIFVTPLPGIARISDILTREVKNRFHHLLFDPYEPRQSFEAPNVFDIITEKDVLVHWPYESFDTVVDFLNEASVDPQVESIKQTLYRTSDDSPVAEALVQAARRGKAVTTIIELEASENELSNVQLAKRLEEAGVHIIYGIVGLKIHVKATLVVRREEDETVLYSHFATGNYHPDNARMYTDISFFTRDAAMGRDANTVFNYVTGGTMLPTEKLIVAPTQLRNRLYEMIDNEAALARSGKPARIYIKVNSLTDPQIAERLYAASEAGVQIDLVVRRHCVLRPGVPGMSENIRVKSIVGRFLEHSRVYVFSNGGPVDGPDAKIFVGSPDLMERNLDDRVEVLWPIEDPDIRHRVVNEIMHANVHDSRQSWVLLTDNSYVRLGDADGFCAQTFFMGKTETELGRLDKPIDV